MNKLSQSDVKYYYDTFRIILDYSNRHFQLNDKVDFINDETLNPNLCKKAADMIWENPSIIDDIIEVTEMPNEQRDLIASWKNCVHDMFVVERHLKNGSIFIGSYNKVYQVLGLVDEIGELFSMYPQPTLVKATLLPFRDVIITDSLYEVLPVTVGGGMKANLKSVYMSAKNNDNIIRQLPEKIK